MNEANQSVADELEKLARLRDAGTLSAKEFKAKKRDLLRSRGAKRFYQRFWFRLPASLIGLVVAYFLVFGSGGFPTCASATAKQTLTQAFDGSQYARTLNVSAIEITAVKEVKFDESKLVRACTSEITMNNTQKVRVDYVLEGRPNGKFMLTFEAKPL